MLRKLAEDAKAAARAARAAKRRKPTLEELERLRAGICRDCDRPVEGRRGVAARCAEHKRADRNRRTKEHATKSGYASKKKYEAAHREELRQKHLEYIRRPAVRARMLEQKREWRRRNRDKVRAQKRRAALRHGWRGKAGPAARLRAYRERVKAGLHKPKPTKRNKNGERLCLYPWCRAVLTGRPKLCPKHKEIGMPTKVQQDVAA